jgi:hypothetical protein
MPDERNILHLLNAHDAGKLAFILISAELYAGIQLALKIVHCHIGLVHTVSGDVTSIGICRIVHNCMNEMDIVLRACSDHDSLPISATDVKYIRFHRETTMSFRQG